MLINESSDQVELINHNHEKANVGNVAVLVSPNEYAGDFPDEYDYNFQLCWIQTAVDPIASIAGDDSLKPCLQPFLSGSASVEANQKVVGKADPIPEELQDNHDKRAIVAGLKLVNHDLPKYDTFMLKHNYMPCD